MISEKLERAVLLMEVLAERNNNDLKLAAPLIADSIRAEVERVRGLEKECELGVSCG